MGQAAIDMRRIVSGWGIRDPVNNILSTKHSRPPTLKYTCVPYDRAVLYHVANSRNGVKESSGCKNVRSICLALTLSDEEACAREGPFLRASVQKYMI